VSFRRATTGESPVLYDLSVGTDGYTPPAQTNTPPVVDAGVDQAVAIPSPAQLKGSACDDNLPNSTLAAMWSKVSGPGTVTFANANAFATAATFSAAGTYVLRLTVNDGQFGVSDEVTLAVTDPTHAPKITSLPITLHLLPQESQNNVINLTPWQVVQYNRGGGAPAASWVLEDGNTTARQTLNSDPSILLSDFTLANQAIEGTWRVDVDDDDDWVGFVFGYQDAQHYYIFDWKQGDQEPNLGGMSIRVVNANTPLIPQDFSNNNVDGNRVRLLYRNSLSWQPFVDYLYRLEFYPGQFRITVKQGNTILESVTLNDSTYSSGKFGFYNHSQGQVVYKSFRRFQTAYSYNVEAIDPDNDPLTWSLVTAPTGMTINSTTGLIQWEPTASNIGKHNVTVRVQDLSGLFDTQSYVLDVRLQNGAPVITSTPITVAGVGRPYSYDVNASDPDNDPLTYALAVKPEGMTINPSTGLIQWTPTAAQIGTHPVRVVVADTGGLTATQDFQVTVQEVLPNNPPVITSTAPTGAAVDVIYSYAATATDPDTNEVLTWDLVTAPTGMLINASTGLIQWQPASAQAGAHNVTVRVRDFSGASATQSFTINVGPPDNTPPVVSIASPAAGATLATDAPVIGSVSDNFLQSWTLEYRVMGGNTWVTLATGTTPVNNATLATFPATLLANNSYILRLRASDFSNQVETFREVIVNSGDLKLGAFALAYEDLRLPGVGVPITIRRFYDSRRVEAGDFGPGWTLGFSNVDIRTDASQNVFITLPNGRRTAFAFQPQLIGFFPVYANRYVAPPGVYDSLENTDSPFLFESGGQWFDLDFSPYNPQNYILRTKEGLTYTLTASGGIRKIEDRNGRFIEITPNGITSSTGRNVTFTRNSQGRITQITDPSNNTLRYEYDSLGRLVRFTDQLNLTTNYTYYSNGHYIQDVLTPGGCRPLKTEYGPDGRVTAKVDNAGNRTTHSYDQANRTETVTDPLGEATVYKYDERGNLIDVLNPLGTRAIYVYDANNNLLSTTYPSGRKIEQNFDSQGNLLTLTKRAPGGAALTDTYTYTSLNQVASITKPQGDRVVFQYDAKGNLTRRESRDTANNALQAESYAYDNQGNLIGSTDGASKTTTFTYNNFGELIRQQDPTGVATDFEYDANGNINARIDGLGNRTEYEYNGFGLLAKVRHGGQVISQTAYNDLGKPTTITDALGRTTTLSYDCQGNLTQVTDAAGKITRYQVDTLTNLKKVTAANNRETNYQYDRAERQTARTGPDGGVWGVSYEADGYVASTTLPSGATIQSEYDGLGRLLRETRPEKTIEYTYADCCQLTQIDERIGASTRRTTISYDGIGRIASVTASDNRTISYDYNARGQRASMTTPDGLVTNYTYDDAGRLTEVRTGADWIRFTYDAAGQRNQSLYRNGASNTYTYNSRGMLTGVVIRDAANVVIASYNYTRNHNGHVTAVAYHDGSASYTLDALNRITGETVTSTSLGNFSRTYSYDDVGNRLDTGATFGPDSRLLSDAGGGYGYNQNGSLIARGAKSFDYDSANRLINFTSTGVAASYEYDFLDRRAAKTVNGVRREFLYDGPKLAAEYVGGAQVARYTYGLGTDEPLMVVRGGQTYFYHADGLGSVVAITNGNGQSAQRYGYDAFGKLRLNSGSFTFDGAGLVNTLTYTGREYDSESGLYHYRARAYDAAIGRFLQKDPQQGNLAAPQSQHLYTYALNNPINFKDPTGATAVVEYSFIIDGYQNQLAAANIGYAQGIGLPGLIFLGEFLDLADSPLNTGAIWDQALERTEERLKDIYKQLGIASKVGDCASKFLSGFPAKTIKAFKSGTDFKILEAKVSIELNLGKFGNKIADCLQVNRKYGETIVDISVREGGFERGAAIGLLYLRSLRPE
jgi:RHS repeat-associated protein